MDEKVLQQIANIYKVSIEKVNAALEESKKFVETQFPKISESAKQNKVLTMTANKFKPTLGGNTANYIGIVYGFDGKTDANYYQRKSQLDLYYKIKKTVEETGDEGALNEIIGVAVNIGENGEPIALYPHLKNDGSASQMAGKAIPSSENSMIRNVYGICYPEDSENPEKNCAVFRLSLKGKAIDTIPPIGKVVSFKCGGKNYNGDFYLNSSATDFVETTDKYLTEGVEAVGLTEVGKKFFLTKHITFDMITDWVHSFTENPNENPIPKEFKQLIYIDDVTCTGQNFQANEKGNITMQFTNNNFSIDGVNDIISSGVEEIGNKIEFASNSTCSIVGQLNIFGNDGQEPTVYVKLFGAVPKKDEFIPRIADVKPIGDEEEQKSETPSQPTQEEPKTVTGGW